MCTASAGILGNLINACMACPPGMLRDRAVSGGCPLGSGQSSSGTFHSKGAGGTAASAVRRPRRGAPAQATSKSIPALLLLLLVPWWSIYLEFVVPSGGTATCPWNHSSIIWLGSVLECRGLHRGNWPPLWQNDIWATFYSIRHNGEKQAFQNNPTALARQWSLEESHVPVDKHLGFSESSVKYAPTL